MGAIIYGHLLCHLSKNCKWFWITLSMIKLQVHLLLLSLIRNPCADMWIAHLRSLCYLQRLFTWKVFKHLPVGMCCRLQGQVYLSSLLPRQCMYARSCKNEIGHRCIGIINHKFKRTTFGCLYAHQLSGPHRVWFDVFWSSDAFGSVTCSEAGRYNHL